MDRKQTAARLIDFLFHLTTNHKLDWVKQIPEDGAVQYQIELGRELPGWKAGDPNYSILIWEAGTPAAKTYRLYFALNQGNKSMYYQAYAPVEAPPGLYPLIDLARSQAMTTIGHLERFIKELS